MPGRKIVLMLLAQFEWKISCCKQKIDDCCDVLKAYQGLSFIYVAVYFGPNELGGMGVFGRWNVGN
jgi:hypothetical protein